jgi:Flp pilus assembly protein TadG
MQAKRMGRWRSDEQGASIIETALISLFLLLLLAGAVDIGRAFYGFIVVTNAAREGARLASRLPCADANRAALRAAIVEAVKDETDSISAGTTVVVTITPDPVSEHCAAAGTPIDVTVSYDFTTIMASVLGVSEFPISNSASMVAFGNDQG